MYDKHQWIKSQSDYSNYFLFVQEIIALHHLVQITPKNVQNILEIKEKLVHFSNSFFSQIICRKTSK